MKRPELIRVGALALLLLFLLQSALPVSASAGAAAEPAGEEDTAVREEDLISIRTAEDLLSLAKSCTLDIWSQGKTVVLEADISLAGVDFLPIATFGGTFDGRGHVISGLKITGSVSPAGLFGILQESALVRDLTVSGTVAPSGDNDAAGGIAGRSFGKLVNCTVRGVVSGSSRLGGVVGLNEAGGQLINCSFQGAVTGEHYVGGIVGWNAGSVIQCVNSGSINTTVVDVHIDYSDLSLKQLNSTENMPAGTDIGGIAGFSTGLLQSCGNTGSVGYEHMGYNVGGIVGRQSGYLDGCVNTGTVRGRKDVGGVAGQLEPQVTLKYSEDTLSDLWDELDTLEELMDRTLRDAEGASDAVSGGMSGLTASVGTAKDTAVSLTDAMTEWANGNMEQINDVSARLSWVLNRMGPVMDDLGDALKQTEIASGQFSDALDETRLAGEWGDKAVIALKAALTDLQNAARHGRDAYAHLESAMTHLENSLGDTAKTTAALKELATALSELSGAFSRVAEATANIGNALSGAGGVDASVLEQIQTELEVIAEGLREMGNAAQRGSEALNTLAEQFNAAEMEMAWKELRNAGDDLKLAGGELDKAVTDLKQTLTYLEEAGAHGSNAVSHLSQASQTMGKAASLLRHATEQTADILRELAEKPAIRFTPIGSDLTERGRALDDALSRMLSQVDALNSTMSASSDVLLADLRAINRQVGVVIDLLRQGSEQTQKEETSGHFEDISDQELYDDQTWGRISGARNTGTVEGDINVAGIAGSIAIEYDFDPEDDLTESGSRSLDFRYQTVAVVTDCVNEGAITAKKNCAGGITGRMDLGTVYACQGYGAVTSSSGDFVGGIAGQSDSAIRDCFAKCILSGGSYVGGIVGAGEENSVTQGCYALVRIADYEQYAGAVSGAENGKFSGNYFVSEDLAGLDRVSYAGKAEPIPYSDLLLVENLPTEFRRFTLTFVAEEKTLQTGFFDYGASLDESVYPDLPQKDGYYVRWDREELKNLSFDTVVTAVYTPYISALENTLCREDGRPIFFIQGRFQEGDRVGITAQTLTPAAFGVASGDVKTALESYFSFLREGRWPSMTVNREVVEQWRIEIPEDGLPAHTVRYLAPDGETDRLAVYVRQGGQWSRAEHEVFGSYLVFSVTGEQAEVAVVSTLTVWWAWLIALVLVLLLIVLAVWLIRRGRRRRRAAGERRKAAAKTG